MCNPGLITNSASHRWFMCNLGMAMAMVMDGTKSMVMIVMTMTAETEEAMAIGKAMRLSITSVNFPR